MLTTFPVEKVWAGHPMVRESDSDCLSWHRYSHHEGCADEHGQCGHALNCPMFRRWVGEKDPL